MTDPADTRYLIEQKVPELINEMVKGLMAHKPKQPLSFILQFLVEQTKGDFTDATWKLIDSMKTSHPGNRCTKYLSKEYYDSLAADDQATFRRCVMTGIENVDSGLGCYAMKPADYETFAPFFDQIIQDYHNGTADSKHETDWDISGVGEGGVLDVTQLGLSELSMRVRVGRNLTAFNLPGLMDRAERIKFEKTLLPAFDKIKEKMGGCIYSLSPDWGEGEANPNLIDEAKYNELVKAHVMFKDMDADPYLKSAGISSDWPYGRGCWQSDDKECIIWFGEEDQLRIMAMKKGTKLNEVFNKLKELLDTFESIEGITFAKSEKYGYVTSCPSNLGTGMRASVHVKVPNLTSDGTDAKAKEICKPLGLSVRGTGGEHTPIGADGTVDISPSARLFIKECEIISKLYQGIKDLMEAEKAAAPA
uniref:Arginine kinase n=1 Tax=Eutreptiella gymnastica TaxID=73025 RepID=A0A7S1J055_9EUGL